MKRSGMERRVLQRRAGLSSGLDPGEKRTRRTGCAPDAPRLFPGVPLRRSPGATKRLLVQEMPLEIPAPAVPPVLVEAEVLAVAETELPGKVHRLAVDE